MDAIETRRIVILDDGAKRACPIKRAQSLARYKPPRRAASLLISTALLTAASLSPTRAGSLPEPRALVHLAQTSNPGELQGTLEQERRRADALARELAAARRDIEVLQMLLTRARDEASRIRKTSENEAAELRKALQQEHDKNLQTNQDAANDPAAELRRAMLRDRAEQVERDLARARGNAEPKSSPAKPNEDAGQSKQAAESALAELQKSLQQERERAGRLEQELAAARRDIGTQTARAAKASEQAAREKQAAESAAAELRKSLQHERDKAEAMAQEVSAARTELSAYEAQARKTSEEATGHNETAERIAELQKSLGQERERAGQLERDLAEARADAGKQLALAAKTSEEAAREKQLAEIAAAELRKSLQQEHDKTEALTQDVSAARASLSAYEAEARQARGEAADLKQSADGAAELKKSLDQERERAGQLEQALAAARRDVETQTALAATAGETAARDKQAAEGDSAKLQKLLQQEHDRAESLAREVSAARAAVFAHEAEARKAREEAADLRRASEGAAELQKSLQQERERAGLQEQKLAAARSDVEAQKALAAKAGEAAARDKQVAESDSTKLQTSLQHERERAGRLEQQLTSALDSIETQKGLAAKAAAEAAREKQAAENGSAQLRRSLQQERDRVARLKRQLAFARSTKEAPTPAASVAPASATGPLTSDRRREADAAGPVATVGEARGGAQINLVDAAEVARLVARANVLLGQGDIGSARIVLERAAETGSAKASFALAETYDPLILPKWGTYGTLGDATKAQALYAKAEAGGVKEAKERFDALRR